MAYFSFNRRLFYRYSNRKSLLIGFVLAQVLLFIYSLNYLVHQRNSFRGKYNDGTVNNLNKTDSLLKNQTLSLKDNFYLVTAVSSKEFIWLLKFIDSLNIDGGAFELLVWGLDLRACEFNYLMNLRTKFSIHLHQFLFHFYPLHIRSYSLNAIKPIILESVAHTFGEVVWVEPSENALNLRFNNIMQILGDKGFIAGGVKILHGQCPTVVIGVNYHRYKAFLQTWAECARNRACISNVSKTNTPQTGVDILFEVHRKKMGFSCVLLERKASPQTLSTLNDLETKMQELCIPHKACILTGNHQAHGCLTPQLARLRRNKEKYSARHGYTYFEETFGFHKFAPCHRVWDKVHAILKYLGDCKILLWVDTDAVFTNMNKTLESFLDARPGKEFLITWPLGDRMPNAGVLLMRNTPFVRELFLNSTNEETWTGNWCLRSKFEQAALRDQLEKCAFTEKFTVERSNTFLQTLCGSKCFVKENYFTAHFAPPNCPHLHDDVKKFLDRYPQFTR